jgi:hypothetical protein
MNLKYCSEMRVKFAQGMFAKQPVDNKEKTEALEADARTHST